MDRIEEVVKQPKAKWLVDRREESHRIERKKSDESELTVKAQDVVFVGLTAVALSKKIMRAVGSPLTHSWRSPEKDFQDRPF